MKNAIVFLLLLLKVSVVGAQYTISIQPPGSMMDPYLCTITASIQYPFTNLDLVTWVFPDGQYKQKEVLVNAQGLVPGTNTVEWWPYTIDAPGPDDIQAYVAKKGGTGNPPPLAKTTLTYPVTPTASIPESFHFPTGRNWQINRSWEFSPVAETFLILSYKNLISPVCPSGPTDFVFRLEFDPDQIDPVEPPYGFNDEIPSDPDIPDYIEVKVPDYQNDNIHHHVFLKVKSTTQIGDSIKIKAITTDCNGIIDSIQLSYVAAAGPHDPNNKTVDIETICSNQPAIKLTYTVQFHNDGDAAVNIVKVTDDLPAGLQPSTFGYAYVPKPNVNFYYTESANGANQEITFHNINLPGIGQTSPSYGYDQTIYRYNFTVFTVENFNNTIKNHAEVEFYDGNISLGTINTNIATVTFVDPGPGVECVTPTSEAPELLDNIDIRPNPFQDRIEVSFELIEKSKLSVEICDIRGTLIQTVASGEYAAGVQHFTCDGTTIPNGVYLIFLRTEKGCLAKRMVKFR